MVKKSTKDIACNKCDIEFTLVWENLKQRQVKKWMYKL
jgi:hypothetical protein